mmetsp:Transcript_5368/g.8294  ORF Transcript_5368/g.8294 Transcript_5368/m.8294 type:complete len:87 (-) Transcript_5368:354-614(-)
MFIFGNFQCLQKNFKRNDILRMVFQSIEGMNCLADISEAKNIKDMKVEKNRNVISEESSPDLDKKTASKVAVKRPIDNWGLDSFGE